MRTTTAILSITTVAVALLATVPPTSANPNSRGMRMRSHHCASQDRFTEMRKRSTKTHHHAQRAKVVKTPRASVCSLFKRIPKKVEGEAKRKIRTYGLRKRGGPAFGRGR